MGLMCMFFIMDVLHLQARVHTLKNTIPLSQLQSPGDFLALAHSFPGLRPLVNSPFSFSSLSVKTHSFRKTEKHAQISKHCAINNRLQSGGSQVVYILDYCQDFHPASRCKWDLEDTEQ